MEIPDLVQGKSNVSLGAVFLARRIQRPTPTSKMLIRKGILHPHDSKLSSVKNMQRDTTVVETKSTINLIVSYFHKSPMFLRAPLFRKYNRYSPFNITN
jgi:hypothetical protein